MSHQTVRQMFRYALFALLSIAHALTQAPVPKKIVVLGGTGYVGAKFCEIAVARGHSVTSLSRRGKGTAPIQGVEYLAGDATDPVVVEKALANCEAVVHCLGLLFDVTTPGGGVLNLIVSGSKSRPGEGSTYDAITRLTAINAIKAMKKKTSPFSNPFNKTPKRPAFAFVSAAEAGWPEVQWGDQVEKFAPSALKRYLQAKRVVETELSSSAASLRPIIFRPSLIWSWDKFDVLPIIPIFNIASALGVPFVDKTIRVETLASAILAGVESEEVQGTFRFRDMEELSKSITS